MDNLNLISNFAEFKELKNIDKSTMIGVLEDVFRHALQKQYAVSYTQLDVYKRQACKRSSVRIRYSPPQKPAPHAYRGDI